jgi:hypothetical protein
MKEDWRIEKDHLLRNPQLLGLAEPIKLTIISPETGEYVRRGIGLRAWWRRLWSVSSEIGWRKGDRQRRRHSRTSLVAEESHGEGSAVRLRIDEKIGAILAEPTCQCRFLAPSEPIERSKPPASDQLFSHALEDASGSFLMSRRDYHVESVRHLLITCPIPPDSVGQEGCFTLGRADRSDAAGSPLNDDDLERTRAGLHPEEE